MAKYQITVHCVDFNFESEVKDFLSFLKSNKAKVTAYSQKKPNFNTFGLITCYRDNSKKEK